MAAAFSQSYLSWLPLKSQSEPGKTIGSHSDLLRQVASDSLRLMNGYFRKERLNVHRQLPTNEGREREKIKPL